MKRWVLLLALLLVACGAPVPAPAQDVVSLGAGRLRGTVAADHRLFQGIPYAAPPIGPLRWRPPQPVAAWTGVRDATAPGARCPQPGAEGSEDCLFLNVTTPADTHERHPVLVWVHGGAFLGGSGDTYDARELAARGDLVVVTLNYRLGALGWLAHPALAHEGGAGNFGLLDQQAALRWVRDNIAAFGGDPARVTVAGESAGAMSVCDHLVSPGSAGLFRAAIVQSGPCQAHATAAAAAQASTAYAANVGCADPATAASCLRALPFAALLTAPRYYDLAGVPVAGPVTGEALLPANPVDAIASGAAARVPVMVGVTRDEFTLFLAQQYAATGKTVTAADYPPALAKVFGAGAPAVAGEYPLAAYDSAPRALAAALTDSAFACVARDMASSLSRTAPVYAYEFDDPHAPAPDSLSRTPFPLGAAHSLELPYLFGDGRSLDDGQRQLSAEMIADWAAFVRTGAPGPGWPRFDPAHEQVRTLAPGETQVSAGYATAHHCDFWAAHRLR
ncbi:carboxylesterase/lipase family protein [Amycolatopsis thermophila]|uniref:Carboxylic ester hydrolase n=1 Tax=Amycolatopsis thermophila TaxID=206084 RepID=A0ABU0EZ33_9PSEU|nr:carboxylesterase/lipase family protein [Amycolatopsis thermophila]MDQ0380579.1 para-nitrobenzyl esterase [Amycolatopsis thermophila]